MVGMQKNKFLKFKSFLLIFLLLCSFQSCTSSIEVAASLGKKYLVFKDKDKNKNKYIPVPIYKIGKKYKVNGKFYFPQKDMSYNKTGIASWYGPKFHGKLTANGEIYNQYALTAAHKTLPLPSVVKVTNLKNNKFLVLRINDRGPFVNDRIIDLSSKAADLLDLKKNGTGLVRVTILPQQSITLEKLAKNGSFPEIIDLPKPEKPMIIIPQKSKVKVEGISSKYKKNKYKKKLSYELKNNYKIFIKMGSFTSLKSAEVMKEKLSYIKKVNIYKKIKGRKTLFYVKSGPYLMVDKVDEVLSLLSSKGMQGAKIVIE